MPAIGFGEADPPESHRFVIRPFVIPSSLVIRHLSFNEFVSVRVNSGLNRDPFARATKIWEYGFA
jgi:hypothetical protein